jgi:hypothetical protein
MTQRKSAPPRLPAQRHAHPAARKPGRSIVNQKRTPWGAIVPVAAAVNVAELSRQVWCRAVGITIGRRGRLPVSCQAGAAHGCDKFVQPLHRPQPLGQ